jgi:predicted DNA-binding transcriptional regulator AlpA
MLMEKKQTLLREAAAARFVDLSLRTLQRLRYDRAGPSFLQLTERRVAYTESDLSTWLAARRQEPLR